MKKLIIVFVTFILAFSAIGMVACNSQKDEENSVQYTYSPFGEFSYKGKTLTDYAVKTITAQEAKNIISKGVSKNSHQAYAESRQKKLDISLMSVNSNMASYETPEEVVNDVLRNYAGCNVTTKYYVDGSDQMQTKSDKLTGLDFKSILSQNLFTPFNQLIAKNIIVFDDLIDYMEEQNATFELSDEGLVAPFKSIFSYHEDANGNLIIQIRDYAEIASSVGGGIAASYRQDTEIIYDGEGKMTMWQTSLGLCSSTPQGTIKEGYILEMAVEWIEKI